MDALVAGGTGTVGRTVVAELVRRGHQVRVLSRRGGSSAGAVAYRGDVETGAGLAATLAGASVVVDCTNAGGMGRRAAERLFLDGTRRLLREEAATGIRHHVLLSIVGIENALWNPYYRAKLEQERLVLDGPVPATVLRATQFHELVGPLALLARLGPVVVAPRVLLQPVAAADVGAVLADAAERPPAGRVPDFGGPRPEQLVEVARRQLRARGRRGYVVPVRVPGAAGRRLREGALLPGPGSRGRQSFDEWRAGQSAGELWGRPKRR